MIRLGIYVRKLTASLVMLALLATGSSALIAIAQPPQTAAAAPQVCSESLLTFPAWYKGLLDKNNDCELKSLSDVGLEKFIFIIAFNVLDIMLQLVAYVAIGFIIYGGFQYITRSNSADGMTNARKTIQNAVIGLIIAIASVAIVKLISGAIE